MSLLSLEDYKNYKVPIGVIVLGLMGAYATWSYAKETFVQRTEYAVYQIAQSEAISGLRKEQIEDKIFALEMIPRLNRSNYDRAKLSRYKTKLEALQ